MEIWSVDKHEHSAVPFRPDAVKPQGEPFVPKEQFDLVHAHFMDLLYSVTRDAHPPANPNLKAAYQRAAEFAVRKEWLPEAAVIR